MYNKLTTCSWRAFPFKFSFSQPAVVLWLGQPVCHLLPSSPDPLPRTTFQYGWPKTSKHGVHPPHLRRRAHLVVPDPHFHSRPLTRTNKHNIAPRLELIAHRHRYFSASLLATVENGCFGFHSVSAHFAFRVLGTHCFEFLSLELEGVLGSESGGGDGLRRTRRRASKGFHDGIKASVNLEFTDFARWASARANKRQIRRSGASLGCDQLGSNRLCAVRRANFVRRLGQCSREVRNSKGLGISSPYGSWEPFLRVFNTTMLSTQRDIAWANSIGKTYLE